MMSAPMTPGLRLMLWATPCLTVYLGLSYLIGDARRYSAPVYAVPKLLLPMHGWGVVFLILGTVNMVLVGSQKRTAALVSICVGMSAYSFWAFVFAAALVASPLAPPPAPGYPALVAVLHLAMLMSILGIHPHLPRWLRRAPRRG